MSMSAIGIRRFGGPEVLECLELERPTPGEGQVLVKLSYAGINFIDVYMRNGTYAKSDTYKTSLPMVLGMEGVGIVAEVGRNVDGFRGGDRVTYCISPRAYAEYAIVPATKLVHVPRAVPLDVAAALQLQGCTAHYLTHSAYTLKTGEVCLIHAGAGGVGQLLIQLAKLLGATVITTVGNGEKAAIARVSGADYCILYRQENFLQKVKEITDGEGVDVVYDSVGKKTIQKSIRCVKRRGLCILFGASSGAVDSISPLELAEAGSIFFTRPHLADYMQSPDEIRWRAGDLFDAYLEGALKVSIDKVLALKEVKQAHMILEGRESKGKLLVKTEE